MKKLNFKDFISTKNKKRKEEYFRYDVFGGKMNGIEEKLIIG